VTSHLSCGRLMGFGLLLLAGSAAAAPSKTQCIAANEKAQDLRQEGKLREARAQLTTCVAASCPGPVREDCARLFGEVDAALPSLVFEVKDRAGDDLGAVRVTADGEALADRLDGTAIVVDPGDHRFVFEANGLPAVEKRVVVREGDKGRHVSVSMSPGAPGGSTNAAEGTPRSSAPSDGKAQRTAGLIMGAGGIAGIVIGSIFGVLTKATYDNALQNECHGNPGTCDSQGGQDGSTAHSQATIATIGFIAGAALLAGGAVLYFTAPKRGVTVSPAVGGSGFGLRVGAQW
jgi:hypothetical protein